jgi:hypothetical protein
LVSLHSGDWSRHPTRAAQKRLRWFCRLKYAAQILGRPRFHRQSLLC